MVVVQEGGATAGDSGQEEGLVGRLVGKMVRRSLRQNFRKVWLDSRNYDGRKPVIWAVNHHGWFDGYVMLEVVKKLGVRSLDWIQEFDSFPLFAKVGGMRFPAGDAGGRAQTMRETIRLMNKEDRSLVLFAEGVLHEGPELLPFGKSLAFVARHVPDADVVPVGIRYRLGIHQKPEAWVRIGKSVGRGVEGAGQAREELKEVLAGMDEDREGFEVLVEGTMDVNERWDMRKIPGRRT